MVEVAGHILNWLAAGVLFPLMVLPLAALTLRFMAGDTYWWGSFVLFFSLAVTVFSTFTPSIRSDVPSTLNTFIFVGLVLSLQGIIAINGGTEKTSRQIADAVESIVRVSGRAVMWLLLVMAFVQFAVVLLRYVFGVNEIFMQESITYLHGAVFLLAAGYALLTNDHVRVDIFYRDAPPKRKAMVDLFGTYLFLFPICLVILWTSSPYVARSWAFFEGSADTSGIQGVFLLKSLIPAFAVLLAMAGFVIAHKAVETLKSGGN